MTISFSLHALVIVIGTLIAFLLTYLVMVGMFT